MQQIHFLVKNPDDTLRTSKAVPHPQIPKSHFLQQKVTFSKKSQICPKWSKDRFKPFLDLYIILYNTLYTLYTYLLLFIIFGYIIIPYYPYYPY